MSNVNTIVGFIGGSGVNQLPSFTATQTGSTTVTYIPVGTNAGTSTAIIRVPNQADIVGAGSPLSVNYNAAISIAGRGNFGNAYPNANPGFNSGSFDGRAFKVRCEGTFNISTSATTSSLIVNLFQGVNSTTVATLTTASLTLATGGGKGNFYVEANMLWDSVSQILTGSSSYIFGFGATATYVASTQVTATTAATVPAGLSFLVGISAGTALVGGITVQPTEFAIDML